MLGKKKELAENVTQVVDYMFRKYLDRNPDPEGLEFYRKALLGGMSLVSFIKSVSSSEEARQKRKGRRKRANPDWPADDIDTVIALTYRLYLQREPDEAGKQIYRSAIERGMSLSTLADVLSSSPEAKQKQQFFSPETGRTASRTALSFVRLAICSLKARWPGPGILRTTSKDSAKTR
ncbi:DUF4214 domain-containing protein [Martelella soudanensis]|uniref:DUF4214 domain-containing protein n=1 Tax=Martelella sp. NC18 TaxID=2740297 RepID=UPI0015DF2B72|nr:DUF4214 domain-containing protein [Martelella sp. NC18]